jgi:hypothetical protein
MHDYTVIYLTANLIPESFANYQRQVLLDAIEGAPLISVSRKSMDFGLNILDDGIKGVDNIYRQMLRASKIATTKYVIIAEDDTLYCRDHFTFYRPESDSFAYNRNRASLFTWGKPLYHWRNRLSNCSLIAPRELLIEALEERFKKYPDQIPENLVGEVGRKRIEKNLGVTIRNCEEVYSNTSIIQINHDFSSEERQRNHKKSYGQIKAYDIPFWGKAVDIVKKFI